MTGDGPRRVGSGFVFGQPFGYLLARPPGTLWSRELGPESSRGKDSELVALAVKDLIDAGVHFGHRASRWNPKMKPYIYGKRNLIHIIDFKETVCGLLRASKYLTGWPRRTA